MASEGPIQFVLDLDASEFTETANSALESIQRIGDSSNLDGLMEGMGGLLEIMGVAAIAVEAFKKSLDLTLEGEQIERTETFFKQLAEQAGISGEQLKEGLENASAGLIDTNALLQIANKSMIAMGASTAQLPQVLELARKAALVTGENVQTVFEGMVSSIEHANTRMLKHYGIVIDQNAAYQKFADSIGSTVGELSEAGKQQAIMNATLEQGQKSLGGINADVKGNIELMQQFKNTMIELKDAIAIAFDKTLGPVVHAALQDILGFTRTASDAIKSVFGSPAIAAAANVDRIKQKIEDATESLGKLERHEGLMAKIMPNSVTEKAIQANKDRLAALNVELEKATKEKEKYGSESAGASEKATAGIKAEMSAENSRFIDQKKHQEEELKFKAEMLALDKQRIADKQKIDQEIIKGEQALDKEQLKNIQTTEGVEKELEQQRVLRKRQSEEAIAKINSDYSARAIAQEQSVAKIHANNNLTEQQKAAEIAKIKTQYANDEANKAKLVSMEKQRYEQQEMAQQRVDAAERIKLMQQMQQNSKSVWSGFANEAKVASTKAKQDLADVATQGKFVFDTLQTSGVSAFENIGAGIAANKSVAQATADAMKSAFLGMIGDTAEHFGEMLLLESVFPPNPVGLAAGAALLAFGGALKGMAGSSSGGGVSVGSSGGGTGGAGAGVTSTPSTAASTQTTASQGLQQQQQVQRTVQINIAGHYLNSQESQRTLMEVMRNETDATGFSYNKIGV